MSTSLLKLQLMKMIRTVTKSCCTMVILNGCMVRYQESSKAEALMVPSTSCLHHQVTLVYKMVMKVLR